MTGEPDGTILVSELLAGLLLTKKEVNFNEISLAFNEIDKNYEALTLTEPDRDFERIARYVIITNNSIKIKDDYDYNTVIKDNGYDILLSDWLISKSSPIILDYLKIRIKETKKVKKLAFKLF